MRIITFEYTGHEGRFQLQAAALQRSLSGALGGEVEQQDGQYVIHKGNEVKVMLKFDNVALETAATTRAKAYGFVNPRSEVIETPQPVY